MDGHTLLHLPSSLGLSHQREAVPCAGIDGIWSPAPQGGAGLAPSAGNKAVFMGPQKQQLKCHPTLILLVTDRVLGLSQSPEVSSQ